MLNKLKTKNNLWLLPLVLIIVLILILRLWKIPEFFSFNFDEEYQASLAWEQVKNFHPIWIGVSASNIGYYLGPGFTYLNAFLFWLSKGDPIIIAYFSALFGIITALSIFFVVKDLFNNKSALIASLIYGGSTLLNYLDRRFWNPSPIPFITVWFIYSLIKAQKNTRWFILSAILIATAYHVHLSLMILWLPFIFLWLKNIKKIKPYTWLISIISYLIITLPLLVFDFVHNFDNMKAPLRFLQKSEQPLTSINISSLLSHFNVFLSSLGRIWFIKFYTNIQEEQNLGAHGLITRGNPILIIASLVILFWVIYKSCFDKRVRIIAVVSFLNIIFFVFYPGYSAEYYLLGFFALFSILIGLFLEKFPSMITYFILSIFILVNAITIFTTTQQPYGLLTRKNLIKKVMTIVGNKPFSLETYGKDPRKYHPYGGWRYLFKAYGKTPVQSFADDFFGWIYQDEISNVKPKLKVIITENIQLNKKEKLIKYFTSGAFTAYIYNNE